MHWLWVLYFGYVWSSIKGNGPEDLTSLVIVGIIASIVIPRARRWWVAREEHLHAKLDHMLKQNAHIIHHSRGIKNEATDGTDMTVVPEHLTQGRKRKVSSAASSDHTGSPGPTTA